MACARVLASKVHSSGERGQPGWSSCVNFLTNMTIAMYLAHNIGVKDANLCHKVVPEIHIP